MSDYPVWICHACGVKYGRVINDHCATYHVGSPCGWCATETDPVTEPRDYGYPKTHVGRLLGGGL